MNGADSINALSRASLTLPIDPAIPASRSASVNAIDVYLTARVRVMHQTSGGEMELGVAAGE